MNMFFALFIAAVAAVECQDEPSAYFIGREEGDSYKIIPLGKCIIRKNMPAFKYSYKNYQVIYCEYDNGGESCKLHIDYYDHVYPVSKLDDLTLFQIITETGGDCNYDFAECVSEMLAVKKGCSLPEGSDKYVSWTVSGGVATKTYYTDSQCQTSASSEKFNCRGYAQNTDSTYICDVELGKYLWLPQSDAFELPQYNSAESYLYVAYSFTTKPYIIMYRTDLDYWDNQVNKIVEYEIGQNGEVKKCWEGNCVEMIDMFPINAVNAPEHVYARVMMEAGMCAELFTDGIDEVHLYPNDCFIISDDSGMYSRSISGDSSGIAIQYYTDTKCTAGNEKGGIQNVDCGECSDGEVPECGTFHFNGSSMIWILVILTFIFFLF